jgi:phage terminase large subunit
LNDPAPIEIVLPPKFSRIWEPARYKIWFGGRGSSKSWSIAQYLLAKALQSKRRVLCAREFQNSIADSVHRLFSDLIRERHLEALFDIQQRTITSVTGSQFLFAGLHHNIQSVKSMEGIDDVWVEEAEHVSNLSWDVLLPTVRKPGSEIHITFNPNFDTDPTYVRFVKNCPPDAIREQVNYCDNPWFPDVLEQERKHLASVDYERYLWIWEGRTRNFSDAQILKGKMVIEDFVEPPGMTPRLGADWGFAKDPTAAVRCYVEGPDLFVTHEVYAYGAELQQIGPLFRQVPDTDRFRILGDCSRPETIAYLASPEGGGFNIAGAEKWPGSVEDGIAFLRNFRRIVVRPSLKNLQWEIGAYSYKVDRLTEDILPVPVDANNHLIDSLRYALQPLITRRVSIYENGVV